MNSHFYVAADFERTPEEKNFNVWAYAMVIDEVAVLKAIDTAFYINRKYKGAIIRYGFTSLSEKQLEKELNKANK
jgi:hypothetical protein